MTYVSLGRKTGIMGLVAFMISVSFLFTTSIVKAEVLENDDYQVPEEFIMFLEQYICHATGDASNPFTLVTVEEMFINWETEYEVDHFAHSYDIVPVATVSEDILDLLEIPFPGITNLLDSGLNLDTEYVAYGMTGQQIYDAGCVVTIPVGNSNDTASTTDNATTTPTSGGASGGGGGYTSTSTTDTATSTETTTPDNHPVDTNLEQCEIEGHKYDQNGNPLPEWQMGLMKIITQGEKSDIWDLAEDMTDSNGYYCLEWDGETRKFRGDTPTITEQPYDFTYHVYEKLMTGWDFLSIEKGGEVEKLVVVDDNDIRFDGDYVSTQIGEMNGYIYANTAYHVDFYNKKHEVTVEEPVIEEETRGSGSSGTRVKNRNGGSSKPEPKVLGEATTTAPLIAGQQVTMIPAGAPDTGAGGTANQNTLTLSQILYISRRTI